MTTNPGRHALIALCLFLPALALAGKLEVIDRIAAVVNDAVIMESELATRIDEIEANLRREGQALPPQDIIREQVLERMIEEKLQLALAERAGIRIDDTSLNDALTGIARRNNMTLEEFAAQVRSEGVDWAQFREDVRNDMAINQLRQRQVSRRIRITDRELDRFLQSELGKKLFENEFRLGHILIRVPDGASPDQARAAEKEAESVFRQLKQGASFRQMAVRHSDDSQALEGGDLGWRPAAQLPSLFAEEAMNMQAGDLTGPLRSGAGFHILKMIDRRGDEEKLVQQHRIRHILVTPNTIRSPDEARKLARELHQQVNEGADMAALAQKYSDDPGSARNGGSLGWVSPGEMVNEFEQHMLATPESELSPVFETQYGWHFLRVEERRTADMSEEFRRLRARQALHQRRYTEELQLWLREIREEAYVDIRV